MDRIGLGPSDRAERKIGSGTGICKKRPWGQRRYAAQVGTQIAATFYTNISYLANLARSHSVRSIQTERRISSTMSVPQEKLEAVRQLYCRYTGSDISLDEVEEFGDYLIRFTCAIYDI
jgi:hypothetical protein